MEQIRLPFPTLNYLAGHAIARHLVVMTVGDSYYCFNRSNSLSKCELRVDKLRLPLELKEYVRNVLRGMFEQGETSSGDSGATIFLDPQGSMDDSKRARRSFEKRFKDVFYREDFTDLVRFLAFHSWHYSSIDNKDFVNILANLQKAEVNTSLEGPEYRLVGEDLHVVFRFVNRLWVPPEFNALLQWKEEPWMNILKISLEGNDVLLTFKICHYRHDEDTFGIHLNLLQPPQRLLFAMKVVYYKMRHAYAQQVVRALNVLDPETRQICLLPLNEARFSEIAFHFLKRCLIPGYVALFIPMMRLVGLNLTKESYFRLFGAIVNNVDLIGFDGLLLQFWELLPTIKKSEFHDVLYLRDNDWHGKLKEAMKTLSRANMTQFRVVFHDLSASLTKEQACNLLCVILV